MSRSRKRFVGIDLGTSNSAIASYQDGDIRVWKDPQQQDVTASVIWLGKRRNKKVGNPAYHSAQTSPEYAAQNFKRFMGSDTKLLLKGLEQEWTPEQCSAEILRELYSYIPPEVQKQCAGVVVTVPAAFDQSQKNATLEAAESASISKITLLQEPVAAVMAATRNRTEPGFLAVYDIGGGTLDVAVAEWAKKGITLHAHGGVAMLGGRDIDRSICKKIVEPWLESEFDLPEGWKEDNAWNGTRLLGAYAAEQAKIRLSRVETTTISMEEQQLRAIDANGSELYLDIPIGRDEINNAIDSTGMVDRSVEKVREVLHEAGVEASSIQEIIFIGGPTHYEPLRRRICEALGIQGSTETDPMTAVAVGAAIFAESVDWETGSRSQTTRKRERGQAGSVRYDLNYDKRVTTDEIKIRVSPAAGCTGATLELVSEQTGWTTGETDISAKTSVSLRVSEMGLNTYKAVVKKNAQRTENPSAIKVTRSLSSVSAVPLTNSIGIGVLAGKERSGRTKMLWLARRGDELPVKRSVDLFTVQSLESGEERSINFKIYTGEHDKPGDNQAHGVLRIMGTDIDEGKLEAGSRLECRYEIQEGGDLTLDVSVPDIRQVFRKDSRNYYAHKEGAMDYRNAAGYIKQEAKALSKEVVEAQNYIDDKRLRRARVLLDEVDELSHRETDPETVKENHDRAGEAKNLLALTRKQHRSTLLQLEVEKVRALWNDKAAVWAENGAKDRVAKLFDAATSSAAIGDDECEDRLDDIRNEIRETLWKQDWYVVRVYKSVRGTLKSADGAEAASLIQKGDSLERLGDTKRLRNVVIEMISLAHGGQGDARWLLEDINVRASRA